MELKRRKLPDDALQPYQMLQAVTNSDISALLQHGCIWLSVTADTAALLDCCCFGSSESGANTAAEVTDALLAAMPATDPQAPRKAIRVAPAEAFFMHYVIGCLRVYLEQPQGAPTQLDTQEFWDWCRATEPDFGLSYTGYHHFRSKGFIPRSGLLYGVDYVLYELHPSLSHSSYGAMLVPQLAERQLTLSWHDIQIANRLLGMVSKSLLLVYIYGPDELTWSSPDCIESLEVSERRVERWNPISSRE